MSYYKNKLTAEQFGSSLQLEYINTYKNSLNKILNIRQSDIIWPDNTNNEVLALIYFAFDLGMSSGPETSLRNRIRDGFITASSIKPVTAEFLNNRCNEYSMALQIRDREKGILALGNVFANYTGHKDDIYIIMLAVIHFRTILKMVVDVINNSITKLI